MADNKLLKVKVRDSQNTLFEGEVDRITSINDVGTFDIYPMHANFISILKSLLIFYNKNNKIKEIEIEQAIMKVKNNVVHIFLGIEEISLDDEEPNNGTGIVRVR
jgi:F0F1-type ATP synthase epsilon subunit